MDTVHKTRIEDKQTNKTKKKLKKKPTTKNKKKHTTQKARNEQHGAHEV